MNRFFALTLTINEQIARKTDERIPNPVFLLEKSDSDFQNYESLLSELYAFQDFKLTENLLFVCSVVYE